MEVNTFSIKAWYYRMDVCAPSKKKKSYVEFLTPSVMLLKDGNFERCLDHENGFS